MRRWSTTFLITRLQFFTELPPKTAQHPFTSALSQSQSQFEYSIFVYLFIYLFITILIQFQQVCFLHCFCFGLFMALVIDMCRSSRTQQEKKKKTVTPVSNNRWTAPCNVKYSHQCLKSSCLSIDSSFLLPQFYSWGVCDPHSTRKAPYSVEQFLLSAKEIEPENRVKRTLFS